MCIMLLFIETFNTISMSRTVKNLIYAFYGFTIISTIVLIAVSISYGSYILQSPEATNDVLISIIFNRWTMSSLFSLSLFFHALRSLWQLFNYEELQKHNKSTSP